MAQPVYANSDGSTSNQVVDSQQSRRRFMDVLTDPWFRDLVVLQDALTCVTYDFFKSNGLKTLHLPITTHSISSPMGLGSDSSPVQISLFGVDTYLADSMQFMLEYGCRLHEKGCYYLMPSFRGELADETHLCQFYHSEAEIPGSLDDVMALVERYVRFMTDRLVDVCGASLSQREANLSAARKIVDVAKFPRVTVAEALTIVGDDPSCSRTIAEGRARVLTRKGERLLIERFGGIVWLTHPPHISVPFYQAYADEEGTLAKSADLLFGLGEVVGCGERHATGGEVRRALAHHGVHEEPYEWYRTLKEETPLQTAGFGLGIERYLCWLLGHHDVRDCQVLPRYNGLATVP